MALRTRRQPPDLELGSPVSSDVAGAETSDLTLSESEAKFRTVFETMIEACTIFDMLYDDLGKPVDWKIVEANPGYERQSGLKDVAGKLASEFMPGTEPYWIEMFARVVETGEAEEIERWHQPTGRWIHSSTARIGGPGSKRLVSVFYDITARKLAEIALRESEERQAFLLELSDALRPLTDPEDIQGTAASLLGEHLGVAWTYYGEVDDAGTTMLVRRCYALGVPSLAGSHPIASIEMLGGLTRGERFAVNDMTTHPLVADATRARFGQLGMRSFAGIPIVRAGATLVALVVADTKPRAWTPAELDLVAEVADRTWAATETARAHSAMRGAREQAERALRVREEFLAIVSHELKTPLSAILLWTRVLARNGAAGQDLEAIETIERNAEAQRILIEDLLDASRFMSGTVKLDMRSIDVGSLAAEVADGMRPLASEGRVRLVVRQGTPVHAALDAPRYAQALRAVLDNAIRYSGPGATVTVSVGVASGLAEVTVSDTGGGIDPEVLPHVFERFRRGVDDSGGLGLGLAIAHDIVTLHGGTLTAESRGRGQGSTFTIRVPATGRRRQPRAVASPRTS